MERSFWYEGQSLTGTGEQVPDCTQRDELLTTVRGWLKTYASTGDAAVLSTTAALSASSRLMCSYESTREAPTDLALEHAAGMLHWHRYHARPSGDPEDPELNAAQIQLTHVHATYPDAVPQELRELVAAVRGEGGRRALKAVPRALRPILKETDAPVPIGRLPEELVRMGAPTPPAGDAAEAMIERLLPYARLTPPHHPDRLMALGVLVPLLTDTAAERLTDLDAAIEAGRQLLLLVPDAGRRYADHAANLAMALHYRYHTTGDTAALDQSIEFTRRSLEHTPSGHDLLPMRLDHLGLYLANRYDRTGDTATLNEMIAIRRHTVQIAAGTADAADSAMALSLALLTLHRDTGDTAALDEAARIVSESASTSPDSAMHPEEALEHRARILEAQFERTRLIQTLQEAIELYRQAVQASSARGADRAMRLARLGSALARYHEIGSSSALDEAIAAQREAVEASPPSDLTRAAHLGNLATMLRMRHDKTGDPATLDEAIKALQALVATAPVDHHYRPPALFNLAKVYTDLHRYDEALAAAREAAASEYAPPSLRLTLNRAWGSHAASAGRWDEAFAGFRRAVALLPSVSPRHLRRGEQEERLAGYLGLASDAAAAALQSDDAEAALEVLEQGRGILLSYALDSRDELTRLREVEPSLADRLAAVRDELADIVGGNGTTTLDDESAAPAGDRRHQLGQEWEELVAAVHALPGFAGFLRPPALADLLPAAAEGPVVTVNVSRYRCDALVLTSEGVRAVPLPDLDRDDVTERVSRFLDELRVAEGANSDMAERLVAQATLRSTLGWLWDTVTGPVLDELGMIGSPSREGELPRVWWSPTGALTFLPLHAAGYHERRCEERPPTVLDRAVSSYAPTVRSLLHARARPRPAPKARRLLTVATPDPLGLPPLPAALEEARVLDDRLPGPPPLIGTNATRAEALAALPRCSWAHFACHAHTDPARPSTSHLVLNDQPITVTDIVGLRLDHAELAYLSACGTGRGSRGLPDESIHIGSACQIAGFTHVVATLWTVDDDTAAKAAHAFYGHLDGDTPEPLPVAAALNAALRQLREATPLLPSRWSPYLHTGP